MPAKPLLSRLRDGWSWLPCRPTGSRAVPGTAALDTLQSPQLPFNLHEMRAAAWDARAQAAAQLWVQAIAAAKLRGDDLPRVWAVNDLGCGNERLAAVLESQGIPFAYQGYDLLPQTANCRRMDLVRDFPPNQADLTCALGLLEYLPDVPRFLAQLAGGTRWAAVSYVAADSGAYTPKAARDRGWRHHHSSSRLEALFSAAGLHSQARQCIDDGRTFVWLLAASGN